MVKDFYTLDRQSNLILPFWYWCGSCRLRGRDRLPGGWLSGDSRSFLFIWLWGCGRPFFFVECVFGTAVLSAFSVAAATAVPEFVFSPAVIFCRGSITLPVTDSKIYPGLAEPVLPSCKPDFPRNINTPVNRKSAAAQTTIAFFFILIRISFTKHFIKSGTNVQAIFSGQIKSPLI